MRHRENRWLALTVLCLGSLMIVLDTTIVNVALPSIRTSLGFSETSLAWIVNAYMLTFGGFLLLGGRLGDLFGPRRLFLIGITLFTLSSLACGLATTQAFLIAARGIQGLGGALVSAVALSLIMNLFVEPTASFILAVYAIVNGNTAGWLSGQTLGLLAAAVGLMMVFLVIESRVRVPLMPLGLLRLRNIATANSVGVLWTASMFAWFFLSALYLQLVLGYSPLQVGLAFLPADLIMAIFSFSLSARLVTRFGIKRPLVIGLLLAAVGLALFARAPLGGNFMVDVLPSMILLGLGGGIALNPLLLAALNDVAQSDSGLASGIVNTSFMMGGALGLAVLASLAAARTDSLLATGAAHIAALNDGYHVSFLVGTLFAILAAALSAAFLRITMAKTARKRA